jgi:hypothetical protein
MGAACGTGIVCFVGFCSHVWGSEQLCLVYTPPPGKARFTARCGGGRDGHPWGGWGRERCGVLLVVIRFRYYFVGECI